jgi:hypothetical protein
MDYASLVLLIVIHVVFDFALQSREIAKNKSSKLSYLLPHLFILMIGLSIYTNLSGRYSHNQGIGFVCGNILLHGLIDWNIWKLYKYIVYRRLSKGKKLYLATKNGNNIVDYKYYDDSMFYNFIAIDQALHGFCYLGLDYLVRSL